MRRKKKIKFRRSIIAKRFIKKGGIINFDDLDVKRPGTGIPPNELKYLVGRKVKRDIGDDELIKWDDVK